MSRLMPPLTPPLMPIVAAVLVAAALFGCEPKKPPAPPPPRVEPASPQVVDSLRAMYRRQYPNCEVGQVVATRASDRLAAVSGVDVSKITENQIVTFIDAHQNTLASGVVVRVLPDSVHVRYDPAPDTNHQPAVGDIMVRF